MLTLSSNATESARPQAPSLVQRKCACGTHTPGGGACASCTDRSGRAGPGLESEVPESVGRTLAGSGGALDASLRDDMGRRFGHDFSGVRVHRGALAERSVREVGARAYTVGNNIVFGAGEYAPATNIGRSLVAHELAHVVQQANQMVPASADLRIEPSDGHDERQAEGMSRAAAGNLPSPSPSHGKVGPKLMRADRTFSLTFDDGPHAAALGKGVNLTEKVLDTLKDKGITAGFFVQTGVSFRGASEIGKALIKRMADEGHKVGIHTGGKADHEDHPVAQQAGRLEGELDSAKQYLKGVTGEEPTMVRPPHGKINLTVGGKAKDVGVLATYKKLSLTNVLWDMDGDQGTNLSLDQLKARIETEMTRVKDRGWKPTTPSPTIVVLYHDIQRGSANNLAALIEHIKVTTQSISGKKDKAVFAAP